MLPKGHYLQWNNITETAEIKNFRKTAIAPKITDAATAQGSIKETLTRAVKRHLISDAPIGVFLSGGIDSSILTLLADQAIHQGANGSSALKTLSINFPENQFSEQPYQHQVVQRISGDHSEYLIDETVFNHHLPNTLQAMDQPSMDGINSWFVNYFARQKGLKAVLSGIGGDELFGGYKSFKRMEIVQVLAKLPRFILKKGIYFNKPALKRSYYLSYGNTIGKYLFLRGVYTPDEIATLLDISVERVDNILRSIKSIQPAQALTAAEEAAWLETSLYMQNQLLKDTDSMSMQHGVEVRVPFLDQDFMQTVASIQAGIRYQEQKPKGLLIDSFTSILPKAIWNRKKMGFTFPFQIWLGTNEFFLNGLKTENEKARNLKADFIKGRLHWSKAMVLYQFNNFQSAT